MFYWPRQKIDFCNWKLFLVLIKVCQSNSGQGSIEKKKDFYFSTSSIYRNSLLFVAWLFTKTSKTKTKCLLSALLCFVLSLTGTNTVKISGFCRARYKPTPGTQDQIPSFWSIVLVMVLVGGAVYKRFTAQPSPFWVLSCLSCSAVFLELYFMFSVFSQFQNVCLHERINKYWLCLKHTVVVIIVMHVCFTWVQFVLKGVLYVWMYVCCECWGHGVDFTRAF